MKVYVPQRVSEIGLEYLEKNGYELKFGTDISEEGMCRDIADIRLTMAG